MEYKAHVEITLLRQGSDDLGPAAKKLTVHVTLENDHVKWRGITGPSHAEGGWIFIISTSIYVIRIRPLYVSKLGNFFQYYKLFDPLTFIFIVSFTVLQRRNCIDCCGLGDIVTR